MKRLSSLGPVLGLAALALLTAVPVRADDGKEIQEKRKVVIVDADGQRQEFETDGLGVRRGYLGVGLVDLTRELRAFFGAPENVGVLVSKVESGSPAERAGVKVGDLLTVLDGKAVTSSWDITSRIRRYGEGEKVALEVRRNNRAQNLSASITLKERPEIDMAPMLYNGDGNRMMIHLPKDGKDLEGLPGFEVEGDGPGAHREVRVIRHGKSEDELQKKIDRLEKRIQELEQKLPRN
jgi:membrane-associated protease RseP (regulator of RpoE activity)